LTGQSVASRAAPDTANSPNLAGQSQSFGASLYRRTSDSVVLIFGFGDDGSFVAGAGFFVGSAGTILTHRANLIDPQTEKPWPNLVAYLKPAEFTGDSRKDLNTPFTLEVKQINDSLDLALVRISKARHRRAVLDFECTHPIEIGTPIMTIGHGPKGYWTTTTGIVNSRLLDEGKDLLLSKANRNPGSPGGPVLNEEGCVVGMISGHRENSDGRVIFNLNLDLQTPEVRTWLAKVDVTPSTMPSGKSD
jgi:S1-C subfamily serine protease